MRLSRAILVMLLLHVVAVGGILAFSLIKERGQTHPAGEPRAEGVEDADAPAIKVESNGARANVHTVQPGETLTRIAYAYGVSEDAVRAANGGAAFPASLRTGQQLHMPEKSPAATGLRNTSAANAAVEQIETGHVAPSPLPSKTEHASPDAATTYVVGKGETVYTIAQKLKTTPEALLKLNGIDDPKKLKIGQRLRVPAVAKLKK